jgi:hypothetical protein
MAISPSSPIRGGWISILLLERIESVPLGNGIDSIPILRVLDQIELTEKKSNVVAKLLFGLFGGLFHQCVSFHPMIWSL